jgi:hypothetical protein
VLELAWFALTSQIIPLDFANACSIDDCWQRQSGVSLPKSMWTLLPSRVRRTRAIGPYP